MWRKTRDQGGGLMPLLKSCRMEVALRIGTITETVVTLIWSITHQHSTTGALISIKSRTMTTFPFQATSKM